eukprot:jgi/Mesvir1/27089/Mv20774-RA.1
MLLHILHAEGVASMYRGIQAALFGTCLSQGVYYYFYSLLRNFELQRQARNLLAAGSSDAPSIGVLGSLLVASAAGALNVVTTNPIWVVVTRMQAHRRKKVQTVGSSQSLTEEQGKAGAATRDEKASSSSISVAGTIRELLHDSGIAGFWAGVLPALLMVTNPAIQFMIYEGLVSAVLKVKTKTARRLQRTQAASLLPNGARLKPGASAPSASLPLPNISLSSLEVFVTAAIAKLGATVITYPMLLVKSRLQAKQDATRQYAGTMDALVKIARAEGLVGFYRGMGAKIVQSVLAAAILFAIKEKLVWLVKLALRSKTK